MSGTPAAVTELIPVASSGSEVTDASSTTGQLPPPPAHDTPYAARVVVEMPAADGVYALEIVIETPDRTFVAPMSRSASSSSCGFAGIGET